jgi:hypothetical protein
MMGSTPTIIGVIAAITFMNPTSATEIFPVVMGGRMSDSHPLQTLRAAVS